MVVTLGFAHALAVLRGQGTTPACAATCLAASCPPRSRRTAAGYKSYVTSASKYLATYLNDHFAGATGGLALARRAASENEGSELGDFLTELAAEIDADRETLREIMATLGVGADRTKIVAARVFERVGRLKPNAQLRGYSPLSPLVELEMLRLGIQGKLALWRALGEIAGALPLDAERLSELAARAERQAADVEARRLEVARSALAPR
jgi:hypothetical protein